MKPPPETVNDKPLRTPCDPLTVVKASRPKVQESAMMPGRVRLIYQSADLGNERLRNTT
jgi:hypothetical protein